MIALKNGPKNRQDLIDVLTECICKHNPLATQIDYYDSDRPYHSSHLDKEYRIAINELTKALTVRLPAIHVREAVHRILYNNKPIERSEQKTFELLCQDVYLGLQRLKENYFGKVYKSINSREQREVEWQL